MTLYDNKGTDNDTKINKSIQKRSKRLQKRRQSFTGTNNSLPLKWWNSFEMRVTMVVYFLFYNIVVVTVVAIL